MSTTVQTKRLQRMFDTDSTIMLETLTRLLAPAEPGPMNQSDLERAFRAAHSIKSEAGFLGVSAVADAAHRVEDTLSRVRKGGGHVDDSTASELERGVRTLDEALAAYRAERSDPGAAPQERPRSSPSGDPLEGSADDRTSSGGLQSSQERRAESDAIREERSSQAERGMLREARRRGERLFRVVVSLAGALEMRYARAFLVVNNLELAAAVVRTEPSLDRLDQEEAGRLVVMVTTAGEEEGIRRAVHVDEVELLELTELSYEEVLTGIPEPDEHIQVSRAADGETVTGAEEELALLADEIVAAADSLARAEASPDPSTVRRVRRYADVLRTRLGRSARVQLLALFRELKPAAVRYAARLGKRVRVIVGGDGALVPPAVGDTLLETALHLMRNSIDHGIETIEERAKKGRHPAATIKVRIDRTGNHVRIIVQDDGTGIDEAAVRARAGDPSSPLLDVLARFGFSMREAADTGSGRGVGLDNVVHAVRTLLNGEIKLKNRPGAGMTFVLSVPAATRLIQVLIVRSGTSAYAVPSSMLIAHKALERRRIKRDSFGGYYYEFEGETLALTTVTGRSIVVKNLPAESIVLIVRAGDERRAIVTDAVVAEEAVVREHGGVRRVYSRTLGTDVGFVFPPGLADVQQGSS